MLSFLLDEDTHGAVAEAFRRRVRMGTLPLVDVIYVGDPSAPPKGIQDPELLVWAEEQDRILVSNDRSTLIDHFLNHLTTGHHSPGVLIVKPGTGIGQLIGEIILISEACTADEFRDRYQFIPH